MPVLVEGRRAQGGILSEANGQRSRENGIVAVGQNLQPMTVVSGPANALVAWASGAATGIVMYAANATSTAQPTAYLARHAEVNLKEIVFPPGTAAAVATALDALGIRCRD